MHTEGSMRAEIEEISLPVSIIGVTQIHACLSADPNEANDACFEAPTGCNATIWIHGVRHNS